MAVAFTARFVDELLSGAWTVLTPTFRRVFGLEPLPGRPARAGPRVGRPRGRAARGLVDRPLVAAPAARRWRGCPRPLDGGHGGRARVRRAAARVRAVRRRARDRSPTPPTSWSSSRSPHDPERAYSRATVLDTCGALLGPAAVAVALFVGASWRLVLLLLAVVVGGYAWAASRAAFPPPPRARTDGESVLGRSSPACRAAVAPPRDPAVAARALRLRRVRGRLRAQVRVAARRGRAVGARRRAVGGRRAARRDRARCWCSTAGCPAGPPPHPPGGRRACWPCSRPPGWRRRAWAAGSSLAIPLAFATALVWPLAKTRSLTIAPELAGASQAVTTLYPIIPLTLAETWFASAVGVGPAMAVTAALGAGLMLLLTLGDDT